MADTPFERVTAHLQSLGVEFRLLHHAPTLTSLDAARERGVDAATGAKSLVIKGKDGLVSFVVPGDGQLDWKLVKAAGVRGARLATDEELLATTGLTKGAVPPLGGLFGLPVFLDRALAEHEFVRFNAGSLTDSVELRGADLALVTGATVGEYRRS